MIKGIQFN